jgi:uncharacterized protein YbaP (TraB family)
MSLLYKIEAKDSSAPQGYLFGTIHLNHISFQRWISLAQNIMSECTLFCPELDISVLQENPNLQEDNEMNTYLEFQCKPSLIKFYRKHFQIDLDLLLQLPVHQLYGNLLSVLMSGITIPGSVDLILSRSAILYKMEIQGLEEFESQHSLLMTMAKGNLQNQVKFILKEPLKFRSKIKNIISLYEAADITAMYQKSKKDAGSLKSELIYKRNIQMAGKTDTILMSGKTSFVAIGAGHLPGEYGMIRLLKQAGYRITPLYPTPI